MKKIRVILSSDAKEVYNHLKEEAPKSKTERTILNAITKKIEIIKSNPHYGDPIAKSLIPREYLDKYEITNLFRVELPNYWRMLYTLKDGDTKCEIIAFVLDLLDHSVYNKKFRYARK
ncbi:MAG: hypothetical protein KAW45_03215 [Thermoplasmatales archaeon]|nr:hypothetical protein [Thermoplasmatales archaeon]